MKGHIEQNKLKEGLMNRLIFWKKPLSNTNERSNELLKMNGQIEQNKLKVLSSN
jgi:hypothetical protein